MRPRRGTPGRDPALLAAACALWGLALLGSGSAAPELYLLPAVLVFLPLLFGVRPGEEILVRLITRRRPRRTRRLPAHRVPRRRPPCLTGSGGRLIARALASRGPPAAAA
jgi:hypothetical protein